MANHGFGSGWFNDICNDMRNGMGNDAGGGAGGPFGMGGSGMGGPFAMGGMPGGAFGAGIGSGGVGAGAMGAGDLDALARQYWSAWGEQLRAAGAPMPAAAPGLDEALGWWSQLARGGRTESNDMLDRFNAQARGWFAQMQQLSGQFSGKDGSAADIASAWKQALGDNPFASVLQGMQGPGQQGVEQWLQQVGPFLQSMQQGGKGLLGLPTFGLTREHQQRWQRLLQAQMEQQEQSKAYQALLAEAGKNAFDRFEDKLAEHSEPGRQLATARALFDLWIDAAEEAYAEIALSPKFREVYGRHANAEMRLRAAVQHEIEETCGLFGIPGRTEVDGAHRKIAQLERELRRLRDAVDHGATTAAAMRTPTPASAARTRRSGPKAAVSAPGVATSARVRAAAAAASTATAAAPVRRAAAKRAAAKSTVAKRASSAKPAVAKRAPAKAAPASRAPLKRVAARSAVVAKGAAAAGAASRAGAGRAKAPSARRKPAAKPKKSIATRASASKRTPAIAAKRKR